MSLTAVLEVLLPTLAPILAGYAVARWIGLPDRPVQTLLRYVFFPALVFTALSDRLPFHIFLLLAAVGAFMTLAGLFLVAQSPRFLRPQVDSSAAVLNIACFSAPFIALSWATKGLATACALFVGMAVALVLVESRRDARSLLREPWMYAAAAALLFHAVRMPTGWIQAMLAPVAAGAHPVLLLYLGAALHPLASWKSADAWATVGIRLASGVGIGLLAVSVLPLSGAMAEGVLLTSLAPPATRALALRGEAQDSEPAQAAATLGTLVSLTVIVLLLLTGWRPWDL